LGSSREGEVSVDYRWTIQIALGIVMLGIAYVSLREYRRYLRSGPEFVRRATFQRNITITFVLIAFTDFALAVWQYLVP
jgi:hypothetical protein